MMIQPARQWEQKQKTEIWGKMRLWMSTLVGGVQILLRCACTFPFKVAHLSSSAKYERALLVAIVIIR